MRQKKLRRAKPKKKKPARKLSLKRLRFVDAYMGEAQGNATAAAKIAGYGSPRQAGAEILSNPVIAAEITRRRKRESAGATLTRQEKKELLAAIARDTLKKNRWNAMKAMDIDNKMDGIYIERHEVTARVMRQPLGEIAEQTAEALRELGATVIPPAGGWPEKTAEG